MVFKHARTSSFLRALCFLGPIVTAAGTPLSEDGSQSNTNARHISSSAAGQATAHPFSRSIIAVGDLHGDFENAFKVLQMANVVDHHGDWSGDVDFFVQTGDIVDR